MFNDVLMPLLLKIHKSGLMVSYVAELEVAQKLYCTFT